MKRALVLSAVLLAACGERVSRPDSRCPCTLDFSDHPRAAEYQELVDRYVHRGLPGLVLLVDSDSDGLWIGASGVASIEDRIEMNGCHVHHGASVAKSYLATVTLLLAEQGQIDLDAPIQDYLPRRIYTNIPNGRSATVRQLMNHTSGIPEYNDQAAYLVDQFNDPLDDVSTEERLAYVYGEDPLAAPGTKVAYADTNFMLLALIVDGITGDHAAELRNALLEPLGLSHTYYHGVDGYPEPECLTNNYFDKKGNRRLENISDVQIYATEQVVGADGIIASPEDFARFFTALIEGEILQSESLDQMEEFEPTGVERVEYGLGLSRFHTDSGVWLGHTGSTVGSGCFVFRNQERGTTIAGFTNLGLSFPSPLGHEFIPGFWDALHAILAEQ